MRYSNIKYPKGTIVFLKSYPAGNELEYLNNRPLIIVSHNIHLYNSALCVLTGSRDRPGISCSLFDRRSGKFVGDRRSGKFVGGHEVTTIYPYNIITIKLDDIRESIGTLDPYIMKAVEQSIQFHLGLTDQIPGYMEPMKDILYGVEYHVTNEFTNVWVNEYEMTKGPAQAVSEPARGDTLKEAQNDVSDEIIVTSPSNQEAEEATQSYFTIKEVSEITKIHYTSLYAHIKNGTLKAEKMLSKDGLKQVLCVSKENLEKYLKERRPNPRTKKTEPEKKDEVAPEKKEPRIDDFFKEFCEFDPKYKTTLNEIVASYNLFVSDKPDFPRYNTNYSIAQLFASYCRKLNIYIQHSSMNNTTIYSGVAVKGQENKEEAPIVKKAANVPKKDTFNRVKTLPKPIPNTKTFAESDNDKIRIWATQVENIDPENLNPRDDSYLFIASRMASPQAISFKYGITLEKAKEIQDTASKVAIKEAKTVVPKLNKGRLNIGALSTLEQIGLVIIENKRLIKLNPKLRIKLNVPLIEIKERYHINPFDQCWNEFAC